MNVSLKWLKEFVDIDLGVEELAHQLTMLGLEIEAVKRPGAGVKNVVIGKILDIKPHPDADKLVVCQTDVGQANPLQIVCGARNMQPGDHVPTAVVGAVLPGGFEIGRRKMRGVESQGMMCSARELGLGDEHAGLLILPKATPVGADAVEILGLDDVIYEIEVTPNRGDWAGMIGVARELAAFLNRPLRLPDSSVVEHGDPVASLTSITIDASDLCARYIGRVCYGLKPAATPVQMAQRLVHAGMRLINPVVDITNYVLLETGHPLHAFDYDKLIDHRIVVRRAASGENIVTIDGESRALRDDILVIADARVPVAIAGVMGGRDSEVGENTQRILIESAWFEPSSIRKTARTLGMNTEASQRFQRGADPEMARYACERVARLVHEICGGIVAKGSIDAYPRKIERPQVSLRFSRTNQLLGTDIPPDQQRSIIERLGFEVISTTSDSLTVRVPSWRHDASREVDLIEEVARLHGYDNIPATVPSVHKTDAVVAPAEISMRKLRRHLAALGLTEMMNLTFTSKEELTRAGLEIPETNLVRLQNPLSEALSIMRPSMIPSLLAAASLNVRRGTKDVRAFELGHAYIAAADQDLPVEEARLGIVLTGLREPAHWGREKLTFDVFDAKGVLENIFDFFGVEVQWDRQTNGAFDPAVSGTVVLDGSCIGSYGKIRKQVLDRYDILQDVYVAELRLDTLLECRPQPATFAPISIYPPSLRDMAVVVDATVHAADLVAAAKRCGGKLLQAVDIFDVYTGKPIPAGKKSVALSLVFQSPERTLTDKDTQKAWDSILKALQDAYSAQLR